MLGDDAVPLVTSALPSLMLTYHWPPLSPARLNWIVEFIPLAASAFKLAGISLKISSGVMQTPPLGWGVDGGVLGHAYTPVKNVSHAGRHARRRPDRLVSEGARVPPPADGDAVSWGGASRRLFPLGGVVADRSARVANPSPRRYMKRYLLAPPGQRSSPETQWRSIPRPL